LTIDILLYMCSIGDVEDDCSKLDDENFSHIPDQYGLWLRFSPLKPRNSRSRGEKEIERQWVTKFEERKKIKDLKKTNAEQKGKERPSASAVSKKLIFKDDE